MFIFTKHKELQTYEYKSVQFMGMQRGASSTWGDANIDGEKIGRVDMKHSPRVSRYKRIKSNKVIEKKCFVGWYLIFFEWELSGSLEFQPAI